MEESACESLRGMVYYRESHQHTPYLSMTVAQHLLQAACGGLQHNAAGAQHLKGVGDVFLAPHSNTLNVMVCQRLWWTTLMSQGFRASAAARKGSLFTDNSQCS